MNIFEFLDTLLFGPTLYYEIVSRYSLEDSLSRLKAAIKPWYCIAPFFESGLFGSVRQDTICLGWDDRWMGKGIVRFRGSLTTAGSGVRLAGAIAVPAAIKIFMALFLVAGPLLFFGLIPIIPTVPLPLRLALSLPLISPIVIVIMTKAVNRNGGRSIADRLDSILS